MAITSYHRFSLTDFSSNDDPIAGEILFFKPCGYISSPITLQSVASAELLADESYWVWLYVFVVDSGGGVVADAKYVPQLLSPGGQRTADLIAERRDVELSVGKYGTVASLRAQRPTECTNTLPALRDFIEVKQYSCEMTILQVTQG